MSLLSAEGILRLCEIVTIVAGLLAVAALVGQSIANKIVGDRKAVEMVKLQTDLSEAKTKQAEAEGRLLALQKRVEWRPFSDHKFREALKDTAKGKVQIVYKRDDDEAYMLASRIWHCLLAAKWDAEAPVPNKDDPESSWPFGLREGGVIASNSPVLSIVASSNEDLADLDNVREKPVAALVRAFVEATGKRPQPVFTTAVKVPEGTVKIVVGGRL